MGWLHTHGASRADIIREILSPDFSTLYRPVQHSARGSELWVLYEHQTSGVKSIALFLLRGNRGEGWGYKDMDEGCEPYYYSCPLKFLDAAPVVKPEWRAKVREWHAAQAAKKSLKGKIQVGSTIVFTPGCSAGGSPITEAKVISLKPLMATLGWINIRVRPRHIAEVR